MKTSIQKKGGTVEASKKHIVAATSKVASAGCSGVKKTKNRNSGWHHKAAGASSFTSTRPLCKPLPNIDTSYSRSASGAVSKLKTGQFNPSLKIKLQLFPIDEDTRLGLEKDGHNPYLELTLRARKKISSVLKHLNNKWGSSTVAQGEPMLFPYNIQLAKLTSHRRWTLNDGDISAADVYAAIESPTFFRLRYGWFSNPELIASTSMPLGSCLKCKRIQKGFSTISEIMLDREKNLEVTSEEFKPQKITETADAVVTEMMPLGEAVDCRDDELKIDDGLAQSNAPWNDSLTDLSIGGLLSEASLQGKINFCDQKSNLSRLDLQLIQPISDVSIGGLLSEVYLQDKVNSCDGKLNGCKLEMRPLMDRDPADSLLSWNDSLTALSIGGLLSEASLQGKINYSDPKSNENKSGMQTTPLISDSFDAFIAGQVNSFPQVSKPSSHDPHSSILDAEETCHAFPSRKFSTLAEDMAISSAANSRGCCHDGSSKPFKFAMFSEFNSQAEIAKDPSCEESNMHPLPPSQVFHDDSSLGLTGIKWTDSLGPFDLGISTSRQVTSGDSICCISEFVK